MALSVLEVGRIGIFFLTDAGTETRWKDPENQKKIRKIPSGSRPAPTSILHIPPPPLPFEKKLGKKSDHYVHIKENSDMRLKLEWGVEIQKMPNFLNKLKRIFFEKITESNGRPVVYSNTFCSALGIPFFRFSPQLHKDVVRNILFLVKKIFF